MTDEASTSGGLLYFLRWSSGILGSRLLQTTALVLAIAGYASYYIAFPLLIGRLIDQGLIAEDAEHSKQLVVWMVGGFVLSGVAGLVVDSMMAQLGSQVLNELRLRMFNKLDRLSEATLERYTADRIITHFANDLAQVENAFINAFPELVCALFTILGMVAAAFYLDVAMAIVSLVVLAIVMLIPHLSSAPVVKLAYRRKQEDAEVVGFVREHVRMRQVVRSFELKADRRQRFAGRLSRLYRACFHQNLFSLLISQATVSGAQLLCLVLLAFGVYLLFEGQLTLGVIVAFIGILNSIREVLVELAYQLPMLISSTGSIQRIQDLLDLEETDLSQQPIVDLGGQLRELHFRGVEASYGQAAPVIRSLDFRCNLPSTTAIVGASGSGKSTLLKLLTRQLVPSGGSIELNGRDIQSMGESQLRGLMAVVSQESQLFHASVGDNIRFGRLAASDAEIEAAAEAAGIAGEIRALPQGYDTLVGDGGSALSVGQRQRVALARALVRGRELLLLDEVSSALDARNEQAVNAAIRRVAATRSIIMVTHRLSLCPEFDQIVVLDGGTMVECGTHDQLLARAGRYAELWGKQMRETSEIRRDGGHRSGA